MRDIKLRALRRSKGGKTAGVAVPNGLAAKPPPISLGIRWTQRRKAALVIAVNAGLLSIDEALWRYSLSAEEFSSWQKCFRYFGMHLPKSGARGGVAGPQRNRSSRE